MTPWERQTRAFLRHLGCEPEPRELPEPASAVWTRRGSEGQVMFDVDTFEPTVRFAPDVTFDGEETYLADQLQDCDMQTLSEAGDVSFEYDGRHNTVTVKRKGLRREELPRYVQDDIVAGARGAGRFQYRSGR